MKVNVPLSTAGGWHMSLVVQSACIVVWSNDVTDTSIAQPSAKYSGNPTIAKASSAVVPVAVPVTGPLSGTSAGAPGTGGNRTVADHSPVTVEALCIRSAVAESLEMSWPSTGPTHTPVSVTGAGAGVGAVGLESPPHAAAPNATRQRTNKKRALSLFNVNRPDAFLQHTLAPLPLTPLTG